MCSRWTVAVFGWLSVGACLAACGSDDAGGGSTDSGPVLVGDAGGDGVTSDADAAPDVPEETTCTINADCRGGEICREGVCRAACSDTIPCRDTSLVCDESRGICVGCVSVADCNELTELCVDNTCVPACSSDASCPPDQVCGNDGTCFVPECTVDANCPGGSQCVDRVCRPIVPTICTADSTRCEDGSLVQCNEDGTAETIFPCDDSVCVTVSATVAQCRPMICTTGELTCIDDRTAGICDDTLTAFEPLRCRSDQYCDAGECVAQVCSPGAASCVGNVVSECDDLGAVETLTSCDETPACSASASGCACVDAECVPRVCTPGQNRCVGNSTQACSDTGTSYLSPVACGSDQFCQSGTCVAESCIAGSTLCTGDTLLTCQADGRTRREQDCASTDQICVTSAGTSRCGAPVCVADTVTCSADRRSRLVCDARGASANEFACPAGQFCTSGICGVLTCDPRTCEEVDAAAEERVDTDDDGAADCIEGLEPGPGGTPACLDPDQDGDGLLDGEEQAFCRGRLMALVADSDDDGWDDLTEFIVGTSRCQTFESPAGLADVVVVLDDELQAVEVAMDVQAPPTDIVLLMDTTGSMGGEINNLRTGFSTNLATPLEASFPDLAWALAEYRDFPCPATLTNPSGTGNSGDVPFRLLQRVTTNPELMEDPLTDLLAAGGGDAPESTWEALYQLATGAGVAGCGATVPAFNPSTNRIAGVADGPLPGVGFRQGATPLVVHITDNVAQSPSAYPGAFAASRSQAISALRDTRGALYVGLATIDELSGSAGTPAELRGIATDLGSQMPVCSWGVVRPGTCSSSQCCTGVAGAGVSPVGGLCSPVATLDAAGTSAVQTLFTVIRGLLRGTPHTTTLSAVSDDDTLDLGELVLSLTTVSASAGSSACGIPQDNGDGWDSVYHESAVTASLELAALVLPGRSTGELTVVLRNDNGGAMASASVLVIQR